MDHRRQTSLLSKLAGLPGIKKVFVTSGIRYDLILADTGEGDRYLKRLVEAHVSGQMKVAPEHMDDNILNLMGKPSNEKLVEFKAKFDRLSKAAKKKQFLTYYFIAAHPGCRLEEMRDLVRQLEETSLPHTCPHGRPTMIHLSAEQLAREFRRR